MPATLPWPKIAQHPAKIGSFSPSITVIWLARNRTSACATVSRTVLPTMFLPSRRAPALGRRIASSALAKSRRRNAGALARSARYRRSNDSQRSTSAPNFLAISSIASSSPISPLSQRSAASAKMVRPTAKPRTLSADAGGGEALLQRFDRGLQAEQHDAAAQRVARRDHVVDRLPRLDRRLRFELPPIRLEAGVVKFGEARAIVSSSSGPALEAMISTRISRPTLRAASKAVMSLAVCAALSPASSSGW